ncbi:hypothetical protein M427DRAFT_52118 [Gonapodya prolifera JEL478]|uniref:Uncharacterized protein n=1 Tax=Gonapodya prolifera (strain JEL478) TaxID=1344416 RepID=A0A139AUY9_GONPJ|nr:hypothetical protein M427DRAFT_52118 [Gonapodya prolifera JEL478]|eukprot:KXS20514.1 hypothetical protein M427DRAFT_52118 [Gonapodya prolifera JEL478]
MIQHLPQLNFETPQNFEVLARLPSTSRRLPLPPRNHSFRTAMEPELPDASDGNDISLDRKMEYNPWVILKYQKKDYLAYAIPRHIYLWVLQKQDLKNTLKDVAVTYHNFADGRPWDDDASEVVTFDSPMVTKKRLENAKGFAEAQPYLHLPDHEVLPRLFPKYWEEACERCDGLGVEVTNVDPPVIPEATLSAAPSTGRSRRSENFGGDKSSDKRNHVVETKCTDCMGSGMKKDRRDPRKRRKLA